MANWVRFADTKATILTAGLGVVLTILMTNGRTVVDAMRSSCPAPIVVGGFAVLALAALIHTLLWVVRAISPRTLPSCDGVNRFAWPTLDRVTAEQLMHHADEVDVRTDVWRQVVDLSSIASKKFGACRHAVKGFALLVLFGAATVVSAIEFTA